MSTEPIELVNTEVEFTLQSSGKKLVVDVMEEALRIERIKTGHKDPTEWIPLLQKELLEHHKVEFPYGGAFNFVVAIQQAFEQIKKKQEVSLELAFGTRLILSP